MRKYDGAELGMGVTLQLVGVFQDEHSVETRMSKARSVTGGEARELFSPLRDSAISSRDTMIRKFCHYLPTICATPNNNGS